jgi:hypothetical protein
MADLKISALTSATTPLGGTEVLPVVQSATTKKTAVSTIKDYILGLANTFTANQTIQTTASTASKMTVVSELDGSSDYQSNFEVRRSGTAGGARWKSKRNASIGGVGWVAQVTANNAAEVAATYTDAFDIDNTGNATVSTGNLVIGTSGKGIAYPVTSGGSALAPAFSVYRSGANQALVTGTFTKVQLNTEEFDTNSNFDSATNYRFTPTVAGYYQISGSVGLTGTNTRILCAIYKNGAEYFRGIDATANLSQVNVSGLVYFNGSTDYIELYAFGTFVGTSDIASGQKYTFLTGVLVRGA